MIFFNWFIIAIAPIDRQLWLDGVPIDWQRANSCICRYPTALGRSSVRTPDTLPYRLRIQSILWLSVQLTYTSNHYNRNIAVALRKVKH